MWWQRQWPVWWRMEWRPTLSLTTTPALGAHSALAWWREYAPNTQTHALPPGAVYLLIHISFKHVYPDTHCMNQSLPIYCRQTGDIVMKECQGWGELCKKDLLDLMPLMSANTHSHTLLMEWTEWKDRRDDSQNLTNISGKSGTLWLIWSPYYTASLSFFFSSSPFSLVFLYHSLEWF